MKSKTKSRITPEQVRELVKIHFPGEKTGEIIELTDGMFNTAYLVKGSGLPEKGVVLKAGPESGTKILTYEKDILRTEVEVYKLLQGKPIPIPRIYAADFSKKVIPCDYFFMEKIAGTTWKNCNKKISQTDRPGLMKELGRCNAAVHSVEGKWFGYIKENERFRFESWGSAFGAMVNDIMTDGRERGLSLPYDEIGKILNINQALLNEIETPRLVDFDMWAGNVFINAEAGSDYQNNESQYHISGVVDFERSFFGDPYADFTSAMMLFSDIDREEEFCAGYSEVSGKVLSVGTKDRKRMLLYRLYMSLIMTVESYRYSRTYAMFVSNYSKGQIRKYIKELL